METRGAKAGFKKGQRVIYPLHGKGQILGLVRRDLSSGPMDFYEIRLDNQPDASIFVPLSAAKGLGLRRPMRERDVGEILAILRSREPQEDVELNWRTWKKRYEEQKKALRQGSPTGLAEVVRNLHEFSKGRPFSSKELRQLYEDTHEQLTNELAEALGGDRKKAERMIKKALEGNARHRPSRNSSKN